jgi:hypothetical protein
VLCCGAVLVLVGEREREQRTPGKKVVVRKSTTDSRTALAIVVSGTHIC